MPIIENPYSKQGIAAKRRASFDAEDFENLCDYMDGWVDGKGDTDKRVNSRHLYQRKLLQIYIYWLAYTGMRTGEVLKLKHGDIGYGLTDKDATPVLRIAVPKDTKTGARTVTSQPELLIWYNALIEHTENDRKEHWLFSDKDGRRNDGFFKTITKLFAEAGVLFDKEGEKRTAYSLRHYYAEQRLIELGTVARAFDIIGKNMGTGRQYLETHYVRKGIMHDEDALVSAGKLRRLNSTGKREMDRALRGLQD